LRWEQPAGEDPGAKLRGRPSCERADGHPRRQAAAGAETQSAQGHHLWRHRLPPARQREPELNNLEDWSFAKINAAAAAAKPDLVIHVGDYHYREGPVQVVLHAQLVELGFPEFVRASPDGHLFLTPAADGAVRGPLRGLKNRLAEFAREIVPDPNVAPNHAWRHRFKTVGMEAGIPPRILDAI